jgi:hypothetical protein
VSGSRCISDIQWHDTHESSRNTHYGIELLLDVDVVGDGVTVVKAYKANGEGLLLDPADELKVYIDKGKK